jgi:DNA-directed RNA polymerase subunit L
MRDQSEDEEAGAGFLFSREETEKVKEYMERIFPYNELIAEINHGQKLNVILKPVLGTGSDNIRWAPCTFLYRFNMDPGWLGFKGIERGQIRHKIEGERSFKHLFIHEPPQDGIGQSASLDKAYDRFGRPYGHALTFQYNGKMNVKEAFHMCVKTLIDTVDLFLRRYIEADTEASMISKESSSMSNEDGSLNSSIELLYIPKNTQDKMPDEDMILTDHTIGNIITTKMLEIIDLLISTKGLDDSIWSQIHIAYKIPHPLIKQCMIMIKIPETLGITHEQLITDAVKEIKKDLNALSGSVNALSGSVNAL